MTRTSTPKVNKLTHPVSLIISFIDLFLLIILPFSANSMSAGWDVIVAINPTIIPVNAVTFNCVWMLYDSLGWVRY